MRRLYAGALLIAFVVALQGAQILRPSSRGNNTVMDPAQASAGDTLLLDSVLTAGNYALVIPSSITPLSPTSEGDPALVQVETVPWQIPFPSDEWTPINNGTLLLSINNGQAVWTKAAQVLAAGGEVVLGYSSSGLPNTYTLTFAVTLEPGKVELLDPIPTVYTPQLRTFITYAGQLMGPSACIEWWRPECALGFLRDWNIEVNNEPPGAESPAGPIQLAFEKYVDEVLFPSTEVSWTQLSSTERSMSDAPDSVKSALVESEVWVYVPDSWKSFTDGAICLRISLGSNGCLHVSSVGAGHLVDLDAYAEVNKEIWIEARPLDDGSLEPMAQWGGGIEIADMAYKTVVETGIVLVTLDAARAPASYQQLSQNPPSSPLASARAISQQELFELLEQEPR